MVSFYFVHSSQHGDESAQYGGRQQVDNRGGVAHRIRPSLHL